jgi:uncharacterized RDD family membrane protein YckC
MSEATARKIPQASEPGPKFETAAQIGFTPADRNKRVIAFIIDALFSGLLQKLVTGVVLKGLHAPASMNMILGSLFVTAVYWIGLTLQFGATPGKRMMGLRIVTEKHKTELEIGQLILRETVGRFISTVPVFMGYFWVSFNKDRKTWHDMIAKTRVVDFR